VIQSTASRVLDHEERPAVLPHNLHRPQCPLAVEFASELELVCKATDALKRVTLGPSKRGHKGIPVTLFVIPRSNECAFAVVPQHFKGVIARGSVQHRGSVGLLELVSL
jgi:hypothetical protein